MPNAHMRAMICAPQLSRTNTSAWSTCAAAAAASASHRIVHLQALVLLRAQRDERRGGEQNGAESGVDGCAIGKSVAEALAHEREEARGVEREDGDQQIHEAWSEIRAVVPVREVEREQERGAGDEVAVERARAFA